MGGIEQGSVFIGINPRVIEMRVYPSYPPHLVVQIDLQRDRPEPGGHLYIPSNKVSPEVLGQIRNRQVEALALNDPEGTWKITDVQLRPGSGGK